MVFPFKYHVRTRSGRVKIELPLDMCHRVLVTAAGTPPLNLFLHLYPYYALVQLPNSQPRMFLHRRASLPTYDEVSKASCHCRYGNFQQTTF